MIIALLIVASTIVGAVIGAVLVGWLSLYAVRLPW